LPIYFDVTVVADFVTILSPSGNKISFFLYKL